MLKTSETVEIVHLTIEGNSSISKHTLEFPIDFYVISGKGTIQVEDNFIEINKNDLISIEPNTERSWTNNESSPLIILGIKDKTR